MKKMAPVPASVARYFQVPLNKVYPAKTKAREIRRNPEKRLLLAETEITWYGLKKDRVLILKKASPNAKYSTRICTLMKNGPKPGYLCMKAPSVKKRDIERNTSSDCAMVSEGEMAQMQLTKFHKRKRSKMSSYQESRIDFCLESNAGNVSKRSVVRRINRGR
jgi:hypothetical protein